LQSNRPRPLNIHTDYGVTPTRASPPCSYSYTISPRPFSTSQAKMPSLFLSRGTPEPSWEVVDHQQVASVPAYYNDDVTITSISPEDVSQTFIFDAPSSSSKPEQECASSSSSSSCYSPRTPSFSSESDGFRTLANHITMRDALISAREQLLHSTAVRKTGANVFFFEGWSVTRLRKGNRYRLRVKYIARPARAVLASPERAVPMNKPPFMDILDEFWY